MRRRNVNRRDFTRNLAGAALAAAALRQDSRLAAEASVPQGEVPGVPFRLSVMLWTVFQKLPFEQRLEKVAEAGYRNVELVGEYAKWSE
jgi:hydroxypyruvate isomerase